MQVAATTNKTALHLSEHNSRTKTVGKSLKILLYVTTHTSNLHVRSIERCWPYIVQNTELIGMADILFFSTGNRTTAESMTSNLRRLLREADQKQSHPHRGHNITLIDWNGNPGKQQGANLALKEAATHGWFRGYDWVVRINPDVLIYNDTWMLDVMRNDHNASAIFVDCHDNQGQHAPHTDFFAVRPSSFPENSYRNLERLQYTAEGIAHNFFMPILLEGKDRWLPETGLHKRTCRVGWRKKWGSPVIHSHAFLRRCPQHKISQPALPIGN
jgi:hypothetical protein